MHDNDGGESSWTWNVCAYTTLQEAEAHAAKANQFERALFLKYYNPGIQPWRNTEYCMTPNPYIPLIQGSRHMPEYDVEELELKDKHEI